MFSYNEAEQLSEQAQQERGKIISRLRSKKKVEDRQSETQVEKISEQLNQQTSGEEKRSVWVTRLKTKENQPFPKVDCDAINDRRSKMADSDYRLIQSATGEQRITHIGWK